MSKAACFLVNMCSNKPSPPVRHLHSSNMGAQVHLKGFKPLLTLTLQNKPCPSDGTSHRPLCFHRQLGKLTLHSRLDTIKMPLTKKKKKKKTQNYLTLSAKLAETELAHGYGQHSKKNELVSYRCWLQEVTPEELI